MPAGLRGREPPPAPLPALLFVARLVSRAVRLRQLMWTHAAHGVNARSALSPTRWCVVNAYRNPGAPSAARWINDDWAEKDVPGLMAPELGAQGLKDHTY